MKEKEELFIYTPIESNLKEEMDRFNDWFIQNLDRSFSDEAIVSVLRFHVLKSYINSGISFEEMYKSMKYQYEELNK